MRKRWRPAKLALFCVALGLVFDGARAAQVSLDFFGMHIHRLVRTQPWLPNGDRRSKWPSVSFGSWRLWDAYVSWPYLQPERSRWDFSVLDRYLSIARTKQVKVLLPLGLVPAWASQRPLEKSGYALGNAAPPANIEDWRRMVRAVVARGKGRVEAYELWNEVNLRQFFTGSMEDLVELARVMHEEVRRGDPAALVVSPSFTNGMDGVRALDRYLALGGGTYADVISFHFYTPSGPPEAMLAIVAEVRAVMLAHGVENKPLWNTEAGFWIENKYQPLRNGGPGEGWEVHDDATAGALLARALIIAHHAGVARYYWYAWDNIDMGLTEAGSSELKLAGQAYARTVEWLSDQDLACSRDSQGLWRCSLGKGQTFLLWAEAGNLGWQAPVGSSIETATDVLGRFVSHAEGRLKVGLAPVKVDMR